MKTWKIIVLIIITTLVGLGAGYLIFGGKLVDSEDHEPHLVNTENDQQIWTCSMHPQVRQNESGDCPICGMELIPLDKISASDNPLVMEMTPNAVKLANIQTIAVGHASGVKSNTIFLTGKVQTDERLSSSLVAHVPGRIEQLFVTYTGEQVRKDQKLATIYSPEVVSAQRELLEAKKWKETQPQLLEAARNKLRYWKISDAMISRLEDSNEIQPNITVYADHSGVVMKRRISVGDYLKEGAVLFDIARLDRVWVLFDAYEEDLAKIKLGNVVNYTVSALPGRTFKARISFIDPLINPLTRIAVLRAEVTNQGGILKPEMFVRGTIETNKRLGEDILAVPKTAVMWTGPRSVVYVEVPDVTIPSYEFREVTLGEASGSNYFIKEGLISGERVVVNGAFVIDAAAQLNNMASMMNRNVMVKGVDHDDHLPDYTETTPIDFKEQLVRVSDAYIGLKDAFVETSIEQAAQEAAQVEKALSKVDMALVDGEAHLYWMSQLKAMLSHNNKIKELVDIEAQRKQFDFLSQALIKSIKVFGVPEGSYYVQHCPMVFNNQGADWISKEIEIRNPYFGDVMLTCGLVNDTITKDFRNPPMELKSNNKTLQGHVH